jgi:hypothetical protein
MPRWNLSDLVLLVLVCGMAFGAYRHFWQPSPAPSARFFLSTFLACLAIACLGSFFARPRWRRPFQGFAVFGWFELVFGIWAAFETRNPNDPRRIAECSQMGLVFGVLCALLAAWLLEPATGGQRQVGNRSEVADSRPSESPQSSG